MNDKGKILNNLIAIQESLSVALRASKKTGRTRQLWSTRENIADCLDYLTAPFSFLYFNYETMYQKILYTWSDFLHICWESEVRHEDEIRNALENALNLIKETKELGKSQ